MAATSPAIQLEHVTKRYGNVVALNDLNLSVQEGVFGFLGPNGAGKTTAVKILLGLTRATRGSGSLAGAPFGSKASLGHIGYLPELFRYQSWLTAREVLALHCELARIDPAKWSTEIDRTLAIVGLADRGTSRVGTFSKGMQQRLGLGVALLDDPAVVLLDEPTSALDPVGRHDVREIIRALRERGTARDARGALPEAPGSMTMTPALVVARQVVREAARRRLLLALILLTIVVIALTVWGVSRIDDLRNAGQPLPEAQKKTIVSQLLILVMFMFSWVLSLAAVFVAAPAISGELESGIALALLARPMSRAEYVVGKWLGLVTLVATYGVTAAIIELVAVQTVSGYLPPHPVEFLGFVLGEGVAILTFALMLSTRLAGMVGGVIAAILFGIAWMGGIVGGVGAAFNNATITHVGTATKLILPTDGPCRGPVWSLEPSLVIAAQSALGPAVAANPFFAAEPPAGAYVAWAVGWIIAMLALAVWSFRSREV